MGLWDRVFQECNLYKHAQPAVVKLTNHYPIPHYEACDARLLFLCNLFSIADIPGYVWQSRDAPSPAVFAQFQILPYPKFPDSFQLLSDLEQIVHETVHSNA